MAGCDEKLEFEFCVNPKSSVFNLSLTLHSTPTEFSKKPYLYNSLERNGSIKKLYNSSVESVKGKVKKLCSVFESSKSPTSVLDESPPQSQIPSPSKLKSGKSLGSDSWLYPFCEKVRLPGPKIESWGFRVLVDDRDISMDSAYKKELQSVLGEKNLSLPQVFIKGKHIGGADVIKQLHEVGELAKMLKGLPFRAPGKIYDEDDDQLKRCLECNENGLIRCPTCCS
ncbi:glutaredoxin family protein [Actinidia rufa]|uniref:Glutaredoxin family protein n=1 Tax=Actinidia rufa TaxID=165716 RepID=A0A7J0F0T2_9ERIC|nr:glutaredoxin family protein [Actinidia rufa]